MGNVQTSDEVITAATDAILRWRLEEDAYRLATFQDKNCPEWYHDKPELYHSARVVGARVNAAKGDPSSGLDFMIAAKCGIEASDMEDMQKWLKTLVSSMDIGPDRDWAGIVLYDAKETKTTPITGDIDALNKYIDDLKCSAKGGRTDLGIEAMVDALKKGRLGASKAGLVIDDGKFSDVNATKAAADQAKAKGIKIFAVGVGPVINATLLKAIASDAKSFFSSKKPENDEFLDVTLVMDGSGSISAEGFRDLKASVEDLLKGLEIDRDRDHVAYVVYSEGISETCPLTWDITELRRRVGNITQPGESTSTGTAIMEMVKLLKAGRPNAIKIGIVCTDGHSNTGHPVIDAARSAKDEKIRMYAVGIDQNINEDELRAIASHPLNVLRAKDFLHLRAEIMKNMSLEAQNEKNFPTETSP